MIKNLPVWAKVLWWASVAVVLGLIVLSINTWVGVQSGRYDSMALLVFFPVIALGGAIVLGWAITFLIRYLKRKL